MSNTIVTFLLDRSGSMEVRKAQTIEAFNAYLSELKKEDSITFSLVQFDSTRTDVTHASVPVKDACCLTNETYTPCGGTPLIDAACEAILATQKKIDEMGLPMTKVVICIQTDGQENASVKYTLNDLHAMIKDKTEAGWQFIFMGVGIDAYAAAASFGINKASTVRYGDSAGETVYAFSAAAANTSSYARGASTETAFSNVQRKNAGDKVVVDELTLSLGTAAPPTPQKDKKALRVLVDKIDLG